MAQATVLLIEDDRSMILLLQTLLEIEGLRALSLADDTDMDKILAEVRINKPDLLLVDVHLHHLSGLELVRRLRDEAEISSVRVLMTSGMEMGLECYQAGADGFILKPFMPDELVAKIYSLLPSTGG